MARALFLALLAANLVFYGWRLASNDSREARASDMDEMQVPVLSLAGADSQAAVGPGESAAASVDVSADAAASVRCLSLGPFSDNEEVAAAELRLGALGLEGKRRRAEGQIWVGYWIFLPPTATRSEAETLMQALKNRGVGDVYVEPAGERENAVSLGVFSERGRAQRRFREIRELGFEPQIARRTRQGTVYWLDFVPGESTRIDPADFQVTSGRIVRLASRVCPQPDVPLE